MIHNYLTSLHPYSFPPSLPPSLSPYVSLSPSLPPSLSPYVSLSPSLPPVVEMSYLFLALEAGLLVHFAAFECHQRLHALKVLATLPCMQLQGRTLV